MKQTMTVAAILICTTLVTNVGNTSVVTNDCREVAPPMVMKAPVENKSVAFMRPPPVTINETVVQPWAERAETEVQPAYSVDLQSIISADDPLSPLAVAKPAIAKSAKPIRLKAAKQTQNRKLRKAPRCALGNRQANRIQRPAIQLRQPKKLTAWEKLQGILIGRPKT
jgi:hypothetical protein